MTPKSNLLLMLACGFLGGLAGQEAWETYASPALAEPLGLISSTERVSTPYEGVPDDIFEVLDKGVALGIFDDRDKRLLVWHHDVFPAGHGERWFYEDLLRKRLDAHLNVKVHPWVLQKQEKTGFYSREDETNEYLGPEMARWCEPEESDCTPPLSVSVLCDMSQVVSCRTIAQAVRMSDRLFLLYPYVTTASQQATYPDVTLLYTRLPNRSGSHGLHAMNSTNLLGETLVFDFSANNSRYTFEIEKPSDIISVPLNDVEQTVLGIYGILGISK